MTSRMEIRLSMNDDQLAQASGSGPAPVAPAGAGPDAADPSAAGAAGVPAIDPSAAEPGPFTQALDMVAAGGPVVAILGVLSVAALAIVLVKLWQFAANRVGDRSAARKALALHRAGRSIEAISQASRSRNPVAQVVANAIRGSLRRDLPEDVVREEVGRLAVERIETLRSYFRPLEVIASVAPLLGLFGTVLGMIEAFQQLEQAGSQVNPAVLSGGIWEALLTTAVGLAVAIPVVAVLAWLERVVDRLSHEMESVVTQVFTRDLTVEPTAHETVEHRHELSRLRPAAALVADR